MKERRTLFCETHMKRIVVQSVQSVLALACVFVSASAQDRSAARPMVTQNGLLEQYVSKGVDKAVRNAFKSALAPHEFAFLEQVLEPAIGDPNHRADLYEHLAKWLAADVVGRAGERAEILSLVIVFSAQNDTRYKLGIIEARADQPQDYRHKVLQAAIRREIDGGDPTATLLATIAIETGGKGLASRFFTVRKHYRYVARR